MLQIHSLNTQLTPFRLVPRGAGIWHQKGVKETGGAQIRTPHKDMSPQVKPVLSGQQHCWVHVSYLGFPGKLLCRSMERGSFWERFTSRQQSVCGACWAEEACLCLSCWLSMRTSVPPFHNSTTAVAKFPRVPLLLLWVVISKALLIKEQQFLYLGDGEINERTVASDITAFCGISDSSLT